MTAFEVVRALTEPVRAKAPDGGGMPTMDVRFSAIGNWYEIRSVWEGNFLERVAPGAFTKTIKENRDNIKVLFNHGFDPQIGQKVLGSPSDIREDPSAAVGVVPLFDTSYNRDLVPGLEAGSYGASMRMVVTKDEINNDPGTSDHNPKGIPERTIKEVRLMEFGPVTFPANPDTSAGVRSMTDEYYERMRTVDPGWVDEVARSIQTTPPDAAAGSTTAERDGAGSTTEGEPGATTPLVSRAQRRARLTTIGKD